MKIKKKTYKSKKVKTLSIGPLSTLDILYFDHSIKKLYKQVKIILQVNFNLNFLK